MAARSVVAALALGVVAATLPAAAQENFLPSLFGGFGGFGGFGAPPRPPPRSYFGHVRRPVADENVATRRAEVRDDGRRKVARRSRSDGGGEQAWCVRTCDGRYFPLEGNNRESKATLCNNFCPASQTEVVYGSTIDDAETDEGKNYSTLPNAFRYRSELREGCTCNGKDHLGLAAVAIGDDPTCLLYTSPSPRD